MYERFPTLLRHAATLTTCTLLALPASADSAKIPLNDIGTLGGAITVVNNINQHGDATGYSETSNGQIHAFVYTRGAMHDIGTPPAQWPVITNRAEFSTDSFTQTESQRTSDRWVVDTQSPRRSAIREKSPGFPAQHRESATRSFTRAIRAAQAAAARTWGRWEPVPVSATR